MLSHADRLELESLSVRYARLADDREFQTMASLFAAAGGLEPAPGIQRVGPGAIAEALDGLTRFDRTFHMLGQVEISDTDPPGGQTYCIAHHFTDAEDGLISDHVMYIRYHDTFTTEDGTWRFAHRRLQTIWSGQEPKT